MKNQTKFVQSEKGGEREGKWGKLSEAKRCMEAAVWGKGGKGCNIGY